MATNLCRTVQKTSYNGLQMSTVNEFAIFVTAQLQERDWSDSDLAKRAGMTPSAVSRVLGGERGVTCNWTVAIAQALGVDPVWALRLADILPDVPPSIAEEQEAVRILRSLPPVQRSSALLMLYGLAGAGPAPKDLAPAGRQSEPVREKLTLDKSSLDMVKLVYRYYGHEPPTGGEMVVDATLVEMLIDQLVQVRDALKSIWRHYHDVTPKALRGELWQVTAQEQQEHSNGSH